jgi:hypothetical protein
MVRVCLLHLAHALHTAQELLAYLEGSREEVEAQRTQHTTANEQRVVHLYGAPYAMGTCSAQHAQALRPSLLTAQGFL